LKILTKVRQLRQYLNKNLMKKESIVGIKIPICHPRLRAGVGLVGAVLMLESGGNHHVQAVGFSLLGAASIWSLMEADVVAKIKDSIRQDRLQTE